MINNLLADLRELKVQALNLEGYNFLEKLKNLKSQELSKLGIEDETAVEGTELNDVIKSSKTLRILYAINFKISDDGSLLLIKYNLRRKKLYPLADLARGLVLDFETLNVVSQSFSKFYNVGEKEITPKMVDKMLVEVGEGFAVNKLDGSNIAIRKYNGDNLISSTGSLSKKPMYFNGELQKNIIVEAEKEITSNIQLALDENPKYCLIFEFIGFSKIVVDYSEEKNGLHLIGVRKMLENNDSELMSQDELSDFASNYGIPREQVYKIKSYSEVEELLETNDFKGTEGVVVYIGKEIYKIKKNDYVLSHQIVSNRGGIYSENTLTQMGNVIATLTLNESIDDYFGVLKGDINPKYIEMMEISNKVINDFEIKVIQKIQSAKDLEDKVFYKEIVPTLPSYAKNVAGLIRKEKFVMKNNSTIISQCVQAIKENVELDVKQPIV